MAIKTIKAIKAIDIDKENLGMNNINWEITWAVVFVGLAVVFAVLLILVFVCFLMGLISVKLNESKQAKNDSAKTISTDNKSTPAPIVKAVAPPPVVEDGITDDVVAAISAAISCIMGTDNSFAVKSIKRTRGSRPVWNLAGINENTRPF